MQFKRSLFSEQEHREISEHFADAFPLDDSIQGNLRSVLKDSLAYPGSLIRAQIAYKLMRDGGAPSVTAKDIAIAIEYFHLASLIFDDLSCMDDATYRRGQLCVHKKYGEAAAVLGALAFINKSYSLIWTHEAEYGSAPKKKVVALLAQCLGPSGILNGQAHDLFYSPESSGRETITKIAEGKTVSLIRLSLLLPAFFSGASDKEEIFLDRIAHFVGLAYQIMDDFKDVSENLQVTGKTTHRDKTLSRPNCVLTLGKRASFDRLKRWRN